MTNSKEIHGRIWDAVQSLAEKKGAFPGLNVDTIAETAKVDMRTARYHLGIMEFYQQGTFGDSKHRVFFPNDEKMVIERKA